MTTTSDDDALDEGAAPLHSFAVLARFRRAAASAEDAEEALRAELEPVHGLFDDVRVEPPEPDGRWALDVRFVVASLDAETAVNGVHETLRGSGLSPDEAWVAERLP
jgi:hypothetical protein